MIISASFGSLPDAVLILTTSALRPLKVSHIVMNEQVDLAWSVDHWTLDEKNSILYYELSFELSPAEGISSGRRRRQSSQDANSEYICFDGSVDAIGASCTVDLPPQSLAYRFHVAFDNAYSLEVVAIFRGNVRSEALVEHGQTRFVTALRPVEQVGATSTTAQFGFNAQQHDAAGVTGYKVALDRRVNEPLLIVNNSTSAQNNLMISNLEPESDSQMFVSLMLSTFGTQTERLTEIQTIPYRTMPLVIPSIQQGSEIKF